MSYPVPRDASGRITGGSTNGGRQPGQVNKIGAAVKEMIVQALHEAGGVEYLKQQAKKNPKAFLALLGRLVPRQVKGELDGAIDLRVIERRIVSPGD